MKRIFTLLFLIVVFENGKAQVSFQPNSIVVYRVGDGASILRSVSTKVFLDEFSPSGTLIQSIAMPTSTSGTNGALTASGTSTSEGLMTRSTDGTYLVMTGYNTDTGYVGVTSADAALVKRVVGRVDATGAINTSTILGLTAFSGNNIRGVASVDGTSFWISGANSGVRYAPLGDTSIRVSSTASSYVSNYRGVQIFNNQLFVTSGSGSFKGLSTVGIGLPTDTGNVVTLAPGSAASGGPFQFFFADLSTTVPGLDVLYIADDAAATGIMKYSYDPGTSTWLSNGSLLPTVTGTRGLTGVVTGSSVSLFIVSGSSTLYSLIDATGYNQTISGTYTLLATAAANTAFRGVALAPTNAIAPLKLITFRGFLSSNKSVVLNWNATNESNLNDFSIERSKDGKEFEKVGSVVAQNKDETSYSFYDNKPFEGLNYYRLKMNDIDSKYSYSEVVTVVNHKSIKTEVFPNPAINKITVAHVKAESGAFISIRNKEGQQVKTVYVVAGALQTNILVNNLVSDFYILEFNNDGNKSVTQFFKQ